MGAAREVNGGQSVLGFKAGDKYTGALKMSSCSSCEEQLVGNEARVSVCVCTKRVTWKGGGRVRRDIMNIFMCCIRIAAAAARLLIQTAARDTLATRPTIRIGLSTSFSLLRQTNLARPYKPDLHQGLMYAMFQHAAVN